MSKSELRILYSSLDLTLAVTHVSLGLSVHYEQPVVTLRLAKNDLNAIICPEDTEFHIPDMNKCSLPNALFIILFYGLSNCLKLNLLCIQVPY